MHRGLSALVCLFFVAKWRARDRKTRERGPPPAPPPPSLFARRQSSSTAPDPGSSPVGTVGFVGRTRAPCFAVCALPLGFPPKRGGAGSKHGLPPSALCGGGLNRNRRVTGTVVGREPRVGESFFCAERAPLPPTLGRRFHSTRPLTPPHSPALDVEISDAGPPSNFFATDGALTKKIDR